MKLNRLKKIARSSGMIVCGSMLATTPLLVSCDSSSDSADSSVNGIEVPDDEGAANAENTGSGASKSGANVSLEANYGIQVFNGINAERVSAGLSGLTRDSDMDSLAAAHNAYMIGNATPNGDINTSHDNAQSRANANASNGFTAFGENTAGIRGYSSSIVASTFVTGWVNSPGHYKNIIGNYSHTGVAVTVDTRDGTIYATQIFAK